MPDDEVFAFGYLRLAVFVVDGELVVADVVGEIAAAGDFDFGGGKGERVAGSGHEPLPGFLNGFAAAGGWSSGSEEAAVIRVESGGLGGVFAGGGFAPVRDESADGGFIGGTSVRRSGGRRRGVCSARGCKDHEECGKCSEAPRIAIHRISPVRGLRAAVGAGKIVAERCGVKGAYPSGDREIRRRGAQV